MAFDIQAVANGAPGSDKARYTISLEDAQHNATRADWTVCGPSPCGGAEPWLILTSDEPTHVTHTFASYGTGARYLRLALAGVDSTYWAGNYGTQFSHPVVQVALLAPPSPPSPPPSSPPPETWLLNNSVPFTANLTNGEAKTYKLLLDVDVR